MDIVGLVHPGHDFFQEGLELSSRVSAVAVVKTKLGDPDGTTSRHGMSSLDLLLEVVGTSPFVRVPVNVDEIDVAASTVAHEVRKPSQTEGRTSVGHSRGAEKCLASKRLHVLLPSLDSKVHFHARGSSASDAKVRLIEAQKMLATSVDGSLCIGWPISEKVGSVAPQHRNIFKRRVESTTRSLVPVVCPRDLRVLTGQGERHGVSRVVV